MKKNAYIFKLRTAILVGLTLGATGCATSQKADSRDPWEGWNRSVQSFNDKLDDYVMKPVARGFKKVTPEFVDSGVTNFFSNIDDINVLINDLLQFSSPKPAWTLDASLSSPRGSRGFVDVASKLDLPKHHEDLDQTLGAWGVPSGPYVVIPLLGPSTPRGVVGLAGDGATNPIYWINPAADAYGTGTLRTIDTRADLLSASKIVDEASVDRYEFIRNAYFQDRNYKIYDGNPPPSSEDDALEKQMDELEHLDGKSAKPN